ncbi:MAG: AMP-binding protein [Nocardioidaceae bacterium]
MTSLDPLAGPPRAVHAALADWVRASQPPPLVVRTSGSTGRPKDVVLSRPAMLASARATLARIGGPGQWLLALPAHYVAGAQVLLRSVVGGTDPVVADEHATFAAAADAMADGVRRYVSLVPTQLVRLLADPESRSALTAFDDVLLGGAAATPTLLTDSRAAGVRVVTTYGMSETCGGCVYDGVPLDGVGVRLDSTGRIHLLGPVLFDGYRDRPELTAETLVDGQLRTPDLGRLDDDGRLEVLGRADDVVVSGGVNVPLPAVEQRLREHPAVGEVAVVGADDQEWGSRVVAFLAVREKVGLEALRDFVSATLPRAWAPRQLVVVPTLPMLDSGKVDRATLRAML